MSHITSTANAVPALSPVVLQDNMLGQLKALRNAAQALKRVKDRNHINRHKAELSAIDEQNKRQFQKLNDVVHTVSRTIKARKQRRESIQSLKDSGLFQQVKAVVGTQRNFSYEQLESLATRLGQHTHISGWSVKLDTSSVVAIVRIQATYSNVHPTILFRAVGFGFERQSFHFDYQEK